MDSPLPRTSTEQGSVARKKLAASLLPAFEPSSSPPLPKTLKRTRDAFEGKAPLPTPVPTSSTNILSSSPTKLARESPSCTERVPLGALPTIRVKSDGTSTKLGRSSQACDYQLSANRLISRVHVEVTYVPSTGRFGKEKVKVECTGWNGVKVHCQSKVFELKRGAIFTSDIRESEIMLDVHDSRVILEWPDKPLLGPVSSDEEDLELSPTKRLRPMRRHSTPPSPSPIQARRFKHVPPISPCPPSVLLPSSPPLLAANDKPLVEIFEDPDPADTKNAEEEQVKGEIVPADTQSSVLSPPQSFSDNDEENDPIISSFGPFGANLLPRFAAVQTSTSPIRSSPVKGSHLPHSEPLKSLSSPIKPRPRFADVDVQSHMINQLAFSRLSSLPLSTILSHLPHDAQSISIAELKDIIRETDCIGEIAREGKDAAGKALENEFYYIPDADDDVNRKEAVVNDLRRPGMRNCRKQHKQYYWKKPK